jgi:hypothetical protein
MTINQIKELFSNIASAHYFINDFAYGELWEIEEKLNKKPKYPMLFVTPVQSVTGEQVKERTFNILVFDMVNKDYSNQVQVWSDTERILDDVIKILRRESKDYELVGEPTSFPFKEDFSDWATGYRAEIVIRTDFDNNYCDIPSVDFISPETQALTTVTIRNQETQAIIATLTGGQSYDVVVASGIDTISFTPTQSIVDI